MGQIKIYSSFEQRSDLPCRSEVKIVLVDTVSVAGHASQVETVLAVASSSNGAPIKDVAKSAIDILDAHATAARSKLESMGLLDKTSESRESLLKAIVPIAAPFKIGDRVRVTVENTPNMRGTVVRAPSTPVLIVKLDSNGPEITYGPAALVKIETKLVANVAHWEIPRGARDIRQNMSGSWDYEIDVDAAQIVVRAGVRGYVVELQGPANPLGIRPMLDRAEPARFDEALSTIRTMMHDPAVNDATTIVVADRACGRELAHQLRKMYGSAVVLLME